LGTTTVTLRLETEQWERLQRFRILNEIETPSAAIRALMEIGMRDAQPLEQAWMKAAWAEGHKAGAKKFRDELEKATKGSASV